MLQDEALWYMLEETVIYIPEEDDYITETAAYVWWLGLDTVLMANTEPVVYRKVFRSRQTENIYNEAESAYYGGAREENGKVYVNTGGTNEFLSFDATMEVGDTIYHGGVELDSALITVHNIDTLILSDGLVRKRWDLQVVDIYPYSGGTDTSIVEDMWVEGIGDITVCLFYTLFCHFSQTAGYFYPSTQHFNCYSLGGEFLISNYYTGEDCSEYFVHTKEATSSLDEINVRIYPNPVAPGEGIVISGLSDIIQDISGLFLYNQFGQQLDVATSVRFSEITIDTELLSPGIYFLSVEFSNGQQKTFKFIVAA